MALAQEPISIQDAGDDDAADPDARDEFHYALCFRNIMVPTITFGSAHDRFVKIPSHLRTKNENWIRNALGFDNRSLQLVDGNTLAMISSAIATNRQKPVRSGRRVDEHGAMASTIEIDVDGFALQVHNTTWPIHVLATLKNMKWLISRLQNEILVSASPVCSPSPTITASSPSTSSISSAGADVEPQTSDSCPDGMQIARAITPPRDDEAIAIGGDSLPTGIKWWHSHHTFVVKAVGIATVRCRVRRKRKGSHGDHIREIKFQRRRAISFLERGCDADDDGDDDEPDVHGEQDA